MPRDILKFPGGKGPCVEGVEATRSRMCWAIIPNQDPPWVQTEREHVSAGTQWVKDCLKVSDPQEVQTFTPEVFRRPRCGLKAGSLPPLRSQCLLQWLLVTLTSLPGTVKVRVCPVQRCPFLCLPFPHPSFPVVTVRRRGL